MYKVRNVLDDSLYAVKKIVLTIRDIKSKFQDELQKLLREARSLAQLNHPNIIRYYNSWIYLTLKQQQ